ncbi:hypothetical protein PR003_g28321 [Phytophthora rubi]|uniref:Secreted protein n=1 Tax=Phytophthora rubi TaxID=129364 RepID=A0A6A3GKU4_9STRA|nr:hypothetical protein PR001_g31564 [Phytophthora rubi]KAE8962941.1 hypothetical protein PR002_g29446 [Phytophthora rubi]KAE9279110.1 hypothetical protein PR003_g28321 [Phytophthora rubi]
MTSPSGILGCLCLIFDTAVCCLCRKPEYPFTCAPLHCTPLRSARFVRILAIQYDRDPILPRIAPCGRLAAGCQVGRGHPT